MEIKELALEVAITQLDKQEDPKGSNWGHPVQDYLKSVGIGFPASWCMAFLYWCFDSASKTLGMSNPMFKTGGVLAQWNNRKENQLPKEYHDLQPGDIFIMDFGKGLGHTGIIEKIENGILQTIEGNTNDTGSREGYEVCRRTREQLKMKGFLRFH